MESKVREVWGQFFLDGWAQFDLKSKEKAYQDLWIQQNISLFQHAGDQKATVEELEQRLFSKMYGVHGSGRGMSKLRHERDGTWIGGDVTVNGVPWSQFPSSSRSFLQQLSQSPHPLRLAVPKSAAVRPVMPPQSNMPMASTSPTSTSAKSSLKQQFMDASGRDIAHDLATIRLSMLGPYPDITNLDDLWTYAIALYQSQDAFDSDQPDDSKRRALLHHIAGAVTTPAPTSPHALGYNGTQKKTNAILSLFNGDSSNSIFFGPPKSMLPKVNNFSPTSVSFFGRFMCSLREKDAKFASRKAIFEQISAVLANLSSVKMSGSDITVPEGTRAQMLSLDFDRLEELLRSDEPSSSAALSVNQNLFKPVMGALQALRKDTTPLSGFDQPLIENLVKSVEETLKRLCGQLLDGDADIQQPPPEQVLNYVDVAIATKETFWNEFVKVYFKKQATTSSCLRELVELLDDFEQSDQYDQYWYEADELYVDVTKVDFEKTVAAIYTNVKPKLGLPAGDSDLESYLCGADQQIQTLLTEFASHCAKVRDKFLTPFIQRNVERLAVLHGDIVAVFQKTAARFEARKGSSDGSAQVAAMEAELEQCLKAAERHMQRFPALILASDGQVWSQPRSLVKSFSKLEADMSDIKAMYLQASHSVSSKQVDSSLSSVKQRLQFLDNSKFKRKLKTWSMMFISCVNEFPDVVTHVFETYRARKIFEPLLTFIGREMIHNHDNMISDFRQVLKVSPVIVLWDFLMVQTLDCFCSGFERGLEHLFPLFRQLALDLPPEARSLSSAPSAESIKSGFESVSGASSKKKKKKKKKSSSANGTCVSAVSHGSLFLTGALSLPTGAPLTKPPMLLLPDSVCCVSSGIELSAPPLKALKSVIAGGDHKLLEQFQRALDAELTAASLSASAPSRVNDEEQAYISEFLCRLKS